MSLTVNRERGGDFYSVAFGKIVKSLGKVEPENMEGVTKRVNKNGEEVYEIISSAIVGNLIGAELKQPPSDHPDWGSQMVLELEANGEKAKLNIPFDSAYGRGFMYISPNIDLSKPIDIEPYKYHSKKKGKEVIGLSLYQDGEKVQWAFGTKANPGGMPQLEKVKFKGKETWDNTKQLEFLTQKFSEFCATVNGQVKDVDVNEPETIPSGEQTEFDDF